MITLCMDTSHTLLALSLIEDHTILAAIQIPCWKKQSEEIFPQLETLFTTAQKKPSNIDAIVVSEGPGSYTGVRIAMTIAKVFTAMKNLDLYTIGTLQLYAGKEDCVVLLDARGGRAYTCRYQDGKPTSNVEALSCEAIQESLQEEDVVVGDGQLVGRKDNMPNLAEHFLALQEQWKKAENVHLVKPEYLKPREAYLVKK